MNSGHMKPAPRQVRDDIAAMEEGHRRLYPVEVQPAPDVTAPPQPEGGAPPPEGQTPVAGDASPPAASSTPLSAPPAASSPQPAPPSDEDYRQRFLTLQGKYNAEVPALQSRLDGLQNVLASLDTRTPEFRGPEPLPADVDEKLKVIREEFGDDFVEAITSHAVRQLQPQFEQLQEAVTEHNKRLEATKIAAAQDAQGQMYVYLAENVPDWRTINRSEAFAQWLGQVDVFSGEVRQGLLEKAYAANSGPRVAAFFLTFLREQTATGAQPNAQPGVGLPAQPTPSRPSLETFAAPGRPVGPTAPPAGASQGRIWTRAQISNFYDEKRRGLWRGRQQECDALELDLIAAGREGRVQG